VWINDRLWRYRPADGFDAFTASPFVAVSAGDFNAGGKIALVTLDAAGALNLWQPDADGHWRPRTVLDLVLPEPETAALAVMDFSGDGRPDILVHHAAGFQVIRAPDADRAASVLFEESAHLTALAPVLVDAARGPSLVGAVTDGGSTRLVHWAPGSGRHAFTAVAPSGRSARGEGMRSNASGIGTGLVVRAGSDWIITDAYDRHSAPGQSLQPVAVGLGGNDRADFIQLHWTDGVLQTEMGLAVGEVHRISETQRQLASCPVLFAWNGERHEFVSDLLGVAGIGFLLEPGVYATPRPWEYFKFPAGSIAPRDGRYVIKIAEPMQEVAYIDTAQLHVYDLPPGWAMTVDERMHTGGGPVPTGAPVFYRAERMLHPVRATDDRGDDVTAALRAADHEAAPPGARHPHFLGRLADEHRLTLEFGMEINPPGSRPVLVAHGWVEYPYSQTLFSAWQAGAEYRPPSLEAFAAGEWHRVYERFGYPAGMPREMSLPLADLPAGTTALRLSGNWEVYWDMIAVVHAEAPPAEMVVHTLGIADARVAKTGFARRDTLAHRRPYYDYNDRSPFWDTQYPAGYYTALGPVEPLVGEANDAFAVIGPGEELHMEFAAPAPPAEGASRVVLLEVRGYAKDMDLYTDTGGTVGPLPRTPGVGDDAERERLHQAYLTRFQKGI
ncbi:MAG: FG-GAP repeat domain-containing protein, partial [Gammaproteobacteria bacterium]